MKKNLCLLLMSALIMAVCLMPASASICMEEDFSVLPEGWEKTETNGGTVTLADQKLKLEFDTTAGAATPTARVDTSVISQSGKDFVIRFVSSFLGSDAKANRRLRAGSGSNLVEPFRLAGTDLRIFNTQITPSEENKVSELLDGSSKEITILIRPAQAAACVWLDGVNIFDGGISWNSRIDFSLMQYSFINTGSNIQASSSWALDSLGVFELGEFRITSTPQDGATFVNASQTNRILLHTGTPFSPSNDLDGIITLKDDSETTLPCAISGGGETIVLSPVSPLAGGRTYTVNVIGLTDMDGGVLTKIISFSTAPEGYTPPSVRITSPAQGTQFFAGQRAEIVAEAESAQGVRQVDFYVDGVLTKSLTQPPYRLELQSLAAKNFQVYATVTDSNNMTDSSDPVTVTFLENLAPEISFLNLTDGMVCQKSELSAVILQAQDPDGSIDRVELYLNGKLFGTALEAPYTFDLNKKSAGIYDVKAVAYDTYGLSSDAALSITIAAKTTEAVIINANFDDGVPADVDLRAQNGTINKDYTVDSAHGKSIYVSVDSGVTSSYPNIALITNSAGTKYVWEGDLYFEDASVSSSRVELVGTEKSSLFSTLGGTLKLYSAGSSQNAGQLESGRWYHFRADIDTDYQIFDFYWDGEQKASKLPLEKNASNLKEIRLFCNAQGNYVLDNVLLKTVVEEPYITGVTFNGKDAPASVPYDAQTIDILLSAGVQSTSVTKDSVLLESSFGPVPLESAVFSAPGTIQITTKYYLLSNEQYNVTLTTGIHSVSGTALSEPLNDSFTTAKKAVDVTDYRFQDTGSTLQFTAKIENTGGEQPVLAVLNVWEGNTLVKSCAVSAKVTKTATLTTPAVKISRGQRAEAFVITDGNSPLGISAKTFLYQK